MLLMPDLATLRSLLPWVIFSPLLVVVLACSVTQFMKKGRWIVHILAFAAMILPMPIYLHVQFVLDPTSIEYPGPGDAIGFFLWLFLMVLSIIVYAAYAWLIWWMRRDRRQARTPT
jgi:hypothetical protein